MILNWKWIFLTLYTLLPKHYATDDFYDTDTYLESIIEYSELSYQDGCDNVAKNEWNFINDPSNHDLQIAWENALAEFASIKKEEIVNIHNQSYSYSDNDLINYKLSVAETPGDALLNATEWRKLVSFSGNATVLRTEISHTGNTTNHSRREIELYLSGNAKAEDKLSAWSNWHRQLLPLIETYPSILRLVSEAATANGADTVESYWELLSGYEGGYGKIMYMWEEIKELHGKLLKFVQNRIAQKYKITIPEDEIPAYLLGSLDGNSWIPVAADVMPYGHVTYEILKNLWEKNLRGITLYRSTSELGQSVLKVTPLANFFQESRFNQSCSTRLIVFCREGETRVSTCHQASLDNFLTSHKVVAKALINQIKDDTTSAFNSANRYSGLEEGVSELFSILSVSPDHLLALNLIDNTTTTEESRTTSLMITALDVLPRLAYYLSADLWRIDAIKNGTFEPKQLLESWWQYRKQYEGVTTTSSDVPTFLDDEFITNNKPYLPKFLGTVYAFQLYVQLTGSADIVSAYQNTPNLNMVLQQGSGGDWTKMISEYWAEMDNEVTPESMTSFFALLVEYLENESEDIRPLTASQEADLEQLEKLHGSHDVTTTPRPTSSLRPKVSPLPPKKSNSSDPPTPPVISVPKPKKEKDEPKIKEPNKVVEVTEKTEEAKDDYTSKMNTSKAVWAVAIVLVATITICIIAIFGRRRCVKSQAPKNRRYV